ncbi:MAG: bifunctional folylpolyglutamate synthase/dihydrofolate synthase [Lachnospiraceae bacterium]|nr:bifunctional folylpolyglutamate synthase/dihydrofolate synthase [Lachnospiraceae bacterium]
MNYEEAREYLAGIAAKGNLLGLEPIRCLLQEMGNPQNDLNFVHIAGTNGKGSVLAYTASILEQAGLRVGRYISPTLFSYEEKIQINEEYITKEAVARLVTEIRRARERAAAQGKPETTIFEVETVLSFLYFREQICDLVLLETGMGGREDATNVVERVLVEIIASISMDHMEFLGNTLEEIAWNKAGIIKKNTQVLSDLQQPEAEAVLRRVCRQQQATLYLVDKDQLGSVRYGLEEQSFDYRGLKNLVIHLAGTCQIGNAALALETIFALQREGFSISEEAIRTGLAKTRWPGRFQLLHKNPQVIVDGAHNPQAAQVLMDAIEKYFPDKKIYYIFGVFSDKEYDKIIRITAKRAEKIFTVETKENPRALPARLLTEAVQKVNPAVLTVGDVPKAIDLALQEAGKEDVILIFGSLSFQWEVKNYPF